MTQLTVKNAEATFLQLQQSSQEIAEKCNLITISNDLELQLATQNYSMLKSTIGQIEDIRVKEKAPYLDAGKQIDALAKKLSSPLETVLEGGKKKVMAYNQEKLRIAQAEQNRINAIKSAISKYSADTIAQIDKCINMTGLSTVRQVSIVEHVMPVEWKEFEADYKDVRSTLNEYCKAKRIEIELPTQADESTTETIKEVIAEKVAEVGVQEVAKAEFQTTTKFRGTWKYEVIDENLVPREVMMVDDKKIKEWIKLSKDKMESPCIIHGIKFYIEESVNIR